MIKEVMPPLTEFEDCLANGVYLCKLGMALLPDDPVWKKVSDGHASMVDHARVHR